MTICDLEIGQSAVISAVGGEGALRQHFLDMGLIPGIEVTLIKYAPMGDPMELMVSGYSLTLRLADAARIDITNVHEHPGGRGEVPEPIQPSKTTLFNQLTGSNQHIGNFPGVTVDRKSGVIKGYPGTEMVEKITRQMEEECGMDRSAAMADMRYTFIRRLCHQTVIKPKESKERIRSQRLDRFLTGKWTAIPAFVAIIGLVFWLTFNVIGAFFQNLLDEGIQMITSWTDQWLTAMNVATPIHSLIIDGVFTGVGSVWKHSSVKTKNTHRQRPVSFR